MSKNIDLEVKKVVTPEGRKVVVVYDPTEGPLEEFEQPLVSAGYHIPPKKFEKFSPGAKKRWTKWFNLEPDEKEFIWVYTKGRAKSTIRRTIQHELEHIAVHPRFTEDTPESHILEELEVVGRTGIRVGTRQWLGAMASRISSYYNLDKREAAELVCQLASRHGPSKLATTAKKVLREGI